MKNKQPSLSGASTTVFPLRIPYVTKTVISLQNPAKVPVPSKKTKQPNKGIYGQPIVVDLDKLEVV